MQLLTAREHFICHKLLTYIYKGNRKLVNAFCRMAFNKAIEQNPNYQPAKFNIKTLNDRESGKLSKEVFELSQKVENIEDLLTQVKTEYENGNTDVALSLSTKAYLDNFEYLETPLKEAGQEELVEDLETMMREELREMIKNEGPSSEVNSKIDSILESMKIVEATVPEFGTIVMAVLIISIIGIIVVTKKTSLASIPRI